MLLHWDFRWSLLLQNKLAYLDYHWTIYSSFQGISVFRFLCIHASHSFHTDIYLKSIYTLSERESVSLAVSDSLWPHELQPTRLLCQWDFPGKNTGVDCHSLLQRIFLTHGLNLSLSHCPHCLTGSLSLAPPGKPLRKSTNYQKTLFSDVLIFLNVSIKCFLRNFLFHMNFQI